MERGPKLVFLGAQDRFLGAGKQVAVEIDDDHAALIRDKRTGALRLETKKQLYFPGPDEVIEEVRELIKLADHEAVIMKHKDGHYTFHYGAEDKRKPGESRSFFLPPHAELVTMWWSAGRRREVRNLGITRFDCRAQFMNFEFNSRTQDNVELVLEGCFFWEVNNLPQLIQTTADASGDVCAHARSQFIKFVSRVTLKHFMENLHELAKSVFETDAFFYEVRGIKVHSLEVTAFKCAEKSVSAVLQEIILETTNRMNRLSQAESENEVKLFKMQGEIEQARLASGLLEIQQQHLMQAAAVEGKAEAEDCAAFLKEAGASVDLPTRIKMWKTLQRDLALNSLAGGRAKLYCTPGGVNLSVQTKEM